MKRAATSVDSFLVYIFYLLTLRVMVHECSPNTQYLNVYQGLLHAPRASSRSRKSGKMSFDLCNFKVLANTNGVFRRIRDEHMLDDHGLVV